MTIASFLSTLTSDSVAVFLFFIIIPFLALVGTLLSGEEAKEKPYSYFFSALIYAASIPTILCLILWGYSIFFEQRSLIDLSFVSYYLPLCSGLVTIILIARKANIRALPWFGELYELLALIAIVFAFILLIMELQIIRFSHLWQVALSFIVVFGLLKLAWERFQRLMS